MTPLSNKFTHANKVQHQFHNEYKNIDINSDTKLPLVPIDHQDLRTKKRVKGK